jgi:hypothetical protein
MESGPLSTVAREQNQGILRQVNFPVLAINAELNFQLLRGAGCRIAAKGTVVIRRGENNPSLIFRTVLNHFRYVDSVCASAVLGLQDFEFNLAKSLF